MHTQTFASVEVLWEAPHLQLETKLWDRNINTTHLSLYVKWKPVFCFIKEVCTTLDLDDTGSCAAPFWENMFSKILLRMKIKYELC